MVLRAPEKFPTIHEGEIVTTRKQQTLYLPEGNAPQQEADVIAAKMQAEAAYREEIKERRDGAREPRAGNQRVMVVADAMRANHFVGLEKDVNRIMDLKNIVNSKSRGR